ncbi:ROK family protein [Diaphorobacter sp. JS3050]|uniref:ROK family protein n=1 Tax=Diaphorobacter sp. JS3050 TaxID=2735554 RepID=UPI0015537F68|nr:ROK family protein [Diaphorobacter sp. JS3050]QJY32035.1 ROK family protein [Diaphorobacter sp. JS3050]
MMGPMPQQPHTSQSPGLHAGVDIGGTKVAVCLADPANGSGPPVLLTRVAEPTAKTGAPDALAQQVLRLLDAACTQQGIKRSDLAGVGVASCGPFVRSAGMVEVVNPNICGGLAGAPRGLGNDWTRVPLQAPLAQALRADRVHVANDAVAALQAERLWGALRGEDDCAYVTWSTGIGVGLCVDGCVLRGKNGNAGHAGHSYVGDPYAGSDVALCGCGNQGDVESLVAGSALPRRLGREAPALMAAADAGDAAALAEVQALCVLMGRLLYNLVATLDLRRISLGGAVFLHHQALLLPLLRAQLARYFPALTAGVELEPAGLGGQVGDYAALALLQQPG